MDNSYLDDTGRLAALAETDLLDSPPEEAFDRVVRLAQRLLSAPIALVSLVDRDRQFFKSAEGLSGEAGEARETPLSHSFCQYVVITGSELVVEDARQDPLLQDNLAIRDLGVIAYVGVPILAPDGERLGSLCAIDSTPRRWTDQEVGLIRDLGRIVNDHIDQRQSGRKLLKSARDLKWALSQLSSFKIAVDHHSLVSVTNRAGIITLANSKFCEVSGYTAAELVGQNHRILNSYAHNRAFFEDMWATIGSGKIWQGDIRNRAKDGTLYWVATTIVPTIGADGRPEEYISIRTEITGHRRLVELLSESQSLAEVGSWEYFLHDKRLEWTKETYRIYELDTSDSIQIQEAVDFFHPDSRELFDGLLQRCITNGSSWDSELRIITAKGNLRWVRSIGRADVEQEQAVRLSGTFQDITERKKSHDALAASEIRFRTLANVLPVGIYETDPDGDCTYANDSWCEIAGLSMAESLGSGWGGAIHAEDRDAVYSEWSNAVKENRDFDFDFRFRHSDGSIRWVHSIATSVIREGEIFGFVGVNEDITERRRSVDAMTASLAEKETLLREIHHRVKNNLQIVSSLLNLQMGYVKDETTLNLFRESQGRIRSMAMIHEMLYAHTELARINAADYLKTLATTVLRSMSANPNRVKLVDKLTPVALNPDRAIPLGLIINELLTNSVKYGATGENCINVNLELNQSETGNIQLEYRDDGPGLPPDFNPKETNSLGFRLIGLLSKQLRAELISPRGGEPLHYRIKFPANDPSPPNPS